MKRKGWILISFILGLICFSGCSLKMGEKKMDGIELTITGTDKAAYHPLDTVQITVQLKNQTEKNKKVPITYQVFHLDTCIYEGEESIIEVGGNETTTFTLVWDTPQEDYKGYLLEAGIQNDKKEFVLSDTIGIDVSSSWVKFPRYGYVCTFDTGTNATEKIAQMNRFHINGIEYYDWHYLHHQPLPENATSDNPGIWQDWSGRKIDGNVIKEYISAAKDRNMVNMAYNMIYAGTDSFFANKDNLPFDPNAWKLFFAEDNDRGEGEFTFHMGYSPSGNGNLYFVNPLNPDWQSYLFEKERTALSIMGFDGWHGDTVGDWGDMTTATGKPLGYKEDKTPITTVKDTYTQFLNAAKEAFPDYYLSFNPVGAQGIENVTISHPDVLYAEFWPWDHDREGNSYDTYKALAKEIERAFTDSRETSFDGLGKSLVVKAYVNYEKTNGFMNPSGVLLCDAAVYAAGGSRLELGNGERMLHKEYYPDDAVLMEEDLLQAMKRMADFTVAYENLLRDGQKRIFSSVVIKDIASSTEGEDNSVWTYIRADENYDILHLINLLGTDSLWRDDIGKKKEPSFVENLDVKYYTEEQISSVTLASPDIFQCKSVSLPFDTGKDEAGSYIYFVLPSLNYWDMVYMKKE